MVMNGFDTNFDLENEFYAVNTVAFHFAKHPIPIELGELVRVYLVNVTEFDPINSFHLHANFFNVYRTGTRLEPNEFTDMIMLAQAERHILEFSFKYPGQYMFHAHQSEFAELGWMGMFDVRDAAAELGLRRLLPPSYAVFPPRRPAVAEYTPPRSDAGASTRTGAVPLLWALIPLLLLGALLALLVVTGVGLGQRTAPPIEELTIDRITLPAPEQIVVEVTNGGADPVTIAQVQVDDAYWSFQIQPGATVPRLGRATISVPYPWVEDDAHAIRIVSSNGVTFDGEVAVATISPRADFRTFCATRCSASMSA